MNTKLFLIVIIAMLLSVTSISSQKASMLKKGESFIMKKMGKETSKGVKKTTTKKISKYSGSSIVRSLKPSPIISKNISRPEIIALLMKRLPKTGKWSGQRGNSVWIPDMNIIPKNKRYNNINGKTYKQIFKEYNCKGIVFKEGAIDFKESGLVKAEVRFNNYEGIGKYLTYPNKASGAKTNRYNLHDKVIVTLAKKLNKIPDEIRIMKGDADKNLIKRLMKKYNCTSEQEVWTKCGNPKRTIYVFHECADGRTVQLVPREIHDNVPHAGGVSIYNQALKKSNEGSTSAAKIAA